MMTKEEQEELIAFLAPQGYTDMRMVGDKMCGLMDYVTTRGICVGLTTMEVGCRFCFQNRNEANRAFAEYTDSTVYPSGNWIKAKGWFNGEHKDDLNPNWSRS